MNTRQITTTVASLAADAAQADAVEKPMSSQRSGRWETAPGRRVRDRDGLQQPRSAGRRVPGEDDGDDTLRTLPQEHGRAGRGGRLLAMTIGSLATSTALAQVSAPASAPVRDWGSPPASAVAAPKAGSAGVAPQNASNASSRSAPASAPLRGLGLKIEDLRIEWLVEQRSLTATAWNAATIGPAASGGVTLRMVPAAAWSPADSEDPVAVAVPGCAATLPLRIRIRYAMSAGEPAPPGSMVRVSATVAGQSRFADRTATSGESAGALPPLGGGKPGEVLLEGFSAGPGRHAITASVEQLNAQPLPVPAVTLNRSVNVVCRDPLSATRPWRP